jgi:hypothetical protein
MHPSDPASEFARTIEIVALTPKGETLLTQLSTP